VVAPRHAPRRGARALALLAALVAGVLGPARGQQVTIPEGVVRDVVIEGEVGVDHALLRSNLRTQPGGLLTQALLDEDVRWLADRHGVVADAIVEPGGVVRFELRRIRRLRDVTIIGNESFATSELLGVGLIEPADATADELTQARALITEHYLDKGYAHVQVDRLLIDDEDGETEGVLRVFEGPQVETTGLSIEGLGVLEPESAARNLRSNPPWFSFVFAHVFSRGDVDRDVLTLQDWVRSQGYLDARAALADLRWNEERDEVAVVLFVDEGDLYTVRSVEVRGAEAIAPEELFADSPLEPGAPYRLADVRRVLSDALERYGDLGYLDARVEPREFYDPEAPVVDLVWDISEGERKTVRDVVVRGNRTTRDSVIRRYLTIYPGEPASLSEMRFAEERLIGLDYFTDFQGQPRVRVRPEDTPDPEQVDVVVEVDDAQSGLFSFLVGAGSDSGLVGGVTIDKRNFDASRAASSPRAFFREFFVTNEAFHGGGQRLLFDVIPGTETTNVDVRFQDPYINEEDENPMGLSLEAYNRERVFDDYDLQRTGLAGSLGRNLDRETRVSAGLRLESTDVDDVDDDAGPTIQGDEGSETSHAFEAAYTKTRLDSRLEPTDGRVTSVGVEVAGTVLGGDTDLFRVRLQDEHYVPLGEDEDGQMRVLHPRLALGWVDELDDDDLPFYENFFVGGNSGPFAMRGFDFQGVGPQENDQAVGGVLAAVMSVEAIVPLYSEYNPWRDERETSVKGVFFVDFGTLAADESDAFSDLRASVGAGVRMRLPALGGAAVAVDLAVPIAKESDDETRVLSFELSRRF